jgi:PAS domain S-box-containing protein
VSTEESFPHYFKAVEELHRRIRELEDRRRELEATVDSLTESLELHRELVDNLNDVIFHLDTLGRITYISPAVERRSGYRVEELLGQPFTRFVHPEDVQAMVENYREIMAGRLEPHRFRLIDKDGTVRHVRSSSRPLVKDGVVTGVVGILSDISDLVRAEEELRRHRDELERIVAERTAELEEAGRELRRREEFYRALIEESHDFTTVLDDNGVITFISPSVKRLFGYDPRELEGKSIFKFIHPEDREEVIREARRAISDPAGSAMVEYRFRHKNGTYRHCESIGRNLKAHPAVGASVINTRDITDRKVLERQLEGLVGAFLNLGADSLLNLMVLTRAACQLSGADLARYGRISKGRFHLYRFIPGTEAADFFLEIPEPSHILCYKVITEGAPGSLTHLDLPEEFAADRDVTELGLRSCLLHPVRARGSTVGCLTVFHRREREYGPRDRDFLSMIAKAMGTEEERFAYEEGLRDFIDVASHELRHPTAVVMGFAQVLLEEYGKSGDPRLREMLEDLLSGTERLAHMIGQLLEVSFMERRKHLLDKVELDLVPLVRGVAARTSERSPDKRISVRVEGGPVVVLGDPSKLELLLDTLLDNAVKYSPEGGEILLELKKTDGRVMVSVHDRGSGVPEEHRERIFDLFYQVEEAQHHSKPGLGLGLYLAREIVEAHGGKIWYEPHPGGGSIFRLIL